MARHKWTKGKIKAGQLIYFEYNAKWREVLVFECPNDPGRRGILKTKEGAKKFLHGIELDSEGAATPGVSTARGVMLSKMGGTRPLLTIGEGIKEETYYQANFGYDQEDLLTPKVAYGKIKSYVQSIPGVYKTYSWGKVKDIRLTNNIPMEAYLSKPYQELEKAKREIPTNLKKEPIEERHEQQKLKQIDKAMKKK